MRIDLPPERLLPDKDERVARILATSPPRRRSTPALRWAAPVAASVAAATVIGLSLGYAGDDPVGTPPSVPSVAAPSVASGQPADVELWIRDLPPDQAAAVATECVTSIGRSATIVASEVLSAQVQRSLLRGRAATAIVIVKDSETGETLGCEATLTKAGALRAVDGVASMGGRGSKSADNHTDATHPAIPTDGPGGYAVGSNGATYEVDERVAAVRQRFVVDGVPGPWHVARAVGRYVFVQARVAPTALRGAHALSLETQVVGHDGTLLDAPGDQEDGGGITRSPGTTRTDDRGWDLCQLATSAAGPSTCLP
ncbi:hypothetical protein FE697_001115 [Mumia zhuanghuii]|uniref:Uncharacterized protein n=2 Tax=Mumia TaxID=1546255 RepID=A0ABW1QHS5_9ACTN|nr:MULTISPECIES: hypothetical protein [Mumia]KAA1424559.1 hypothetical protein FE697_001115 [Mumia zhuanghuii]